MNDHAYYEELIMAAVDGEITPEEEAELRAHTDECPRCRAFWEAMAAVNGAAAKDLPPAPEGFARDVMAAVRSRAPKKKKAQILAAPWRALSLAAVAALVLWVGARLAPAFMAKGASSSAAPQSMMAAGAVDTTTSADEAEAETEEAAPEMAFDALPSGENRADQGASFPAAGAQPAENAPAEEFADSNEADEIPQTPELQPAAMTYKVYAGEDLQSAPLVSGSGWDMARLLTAGRPCPVPERAADYTAAVFEPEEHIWLLWAEDGAVIVMDTQTETAGYSMAPELLEEILP